MKPKTKKFIRFDVTVFSIVALEAIFKFTLAIFRLDRFSENTFMEEENVNSDLYNLVHVLLEAFSTEQQLMLETKLAIFLTRIIFKLKSETNKSN